MEGTEGLHTTHILLFNLFIAKIHPPCSAQTMSAKEKGKFEEMARLDKARYEREMKNYVPPRGEKKKRFKDPNAPKRPP